MNDVSLRHVATRGERRPASDGPGYVVAGAGTPVVMLHSSLGSKSQWSALAERLAPRYRPIALDLRGYGDGALPAPGLAFTVDDELRLVVERLDPLVEADECFHLIGHSYGGLVALRLAQRHPARVASLALYEPVAFRLLDEEDPALIDVRRLGTCVSGLIAAGRRFDAARAFVDFWNGEGSYAALSLPIQASMARRVDKLPLDFQVASSWPMRQDLAAIVAPTLLLTGTRSPQAMQRIHARLAGALADCRARSVMAGRMGPVTDPIASIAGSRRSWMNAPRAVSRVHAHRRSRGSSP